MSADAVGITPVFSGSGVAASNPVTTSVAGSSFLAWVPHDAGATVGVADTVGGVATGNVFVAVPAALNDFAGGDVFLCRNGVGGVNHIFVATTLTGGTNLEIFPVELTSCDLTAALVDALSSPNWKVDTHSDATPYTSNGVTTISAVDLVLSFFTSFTNSGAESVAHGNGFSAVIADGDITHFSGGIGKLLTSGTGTFASSITSSGGGVTAYATCLIAFKAATGTAPTVTDVDTDEAINEGQTSVSVTGTAMDAAGGRTFALVQGSVVVTQTETGTPTDTAAALTIVTESTTSLKFGTAALRVTRTSDSGTGSLAVTVNPPTGLIFVDVGTPDTTSAERITAVSDIVSGDQIEARAVGGGAAPTGLTLNTDGTYYYTSGNTPIAFDVRVWDQSDSTWGSWATQTILASPLINAQPVSQTAAVGGTETFTISAVASLGGGTLSYQWKVNGSNVGTNAASYTTAALSSGDNGKIVTCVVTDSNGSTTSLPVFIWIKGIKTGYGVRMRSALLRRSATRGAADSRAKGFALLRKQRPGVTAQRDVFLDFIGFTAPSALGAMVGTTSVAFTAAALIKGVTHAVGSTTLAFTESAVARGKTHLVGAAALAFAQAGTIRGATHLAGSIALTFAESGTLKGTAALSGSATLAFTESATIKGLGALAGTTSIAFTNSATPSTSRSGTTSLSFSVSATIRARGAMAGTAALVFTDTATIKGLAPAAGSAALTFASAATAKGLGAMAGTTSIVFESTASRSGAMAGSTSLNFSTAATIKGVGRIQGSSAVLFAQTATAKGLGKIAGTTPLVFAQTAVARGLGLISASSALVFADSALLRGVTHLSGTATLAFTCAAAFSGSSAMRGSTSIAFSSSATIRATGALRGSTSIAMAPTAHARGLGAMAATTSISFSATGNLRLLAHISGTTAIAFDTLATIGGRGKVSGTAHLAFASSARATGLGRIAGTSSIVFAGTAREGSTQFISGSAQLTLDCTGQLLGRGHMHGVSSIAFSGSGALRGTARGSGAAHLVFSCHAQLTGAVFITPERRHVIGHTESRAQTVHAAGGREGRVHTGRRRSREERP